MQNVYNIFKYSYYIGISTKNKNIGSHSVFYQLIIHQFTMTCWPSVHKCIVWLDIFRYNRNAKSHYVIIFHFSNSFLHQCYRFCEDIYTYVHRNRSTKISEQSWLYQYNLWNTNARFKALDSRRWMQRTANKKIIQTRLPYSIIAIDACRGFEMNCNQEFYSSSWKPSPVCLTCLIKQFLVL